MKQQIYHDSIMCNALHAMEEEMNAIFSRSERRHDVIEIKVATVFFVRADHPFLDVAQQITLIGFPVHQ